MNATIFWRILWKEYRAQRAFWISMAVLTLVVEWLLRVGHWDSDVVRIHALFMTGLGLAAFYALASGATLFAMEREAETYDFLRALTVKPLVVAAGKIAFSLASAAAMFLVAWTLAMLLAQGVPKPLDHQTIWAIWGLAGLEFWAWGIFFSLLQKRPLLAVILALTCVAVIISQFVGVDIHIVVPGRLLIVAVVAVADIGLAACWFRAERHLPVRPRSPRASEAAGWGLDRAPFAAGMLGRLVWQEIRQSAAMTVGLIVMLLPLVFFFYMQWLFRLAPDVRSAWFRHSRPEFLFAGLFSGPLLGSSVFLADQTGCRFRFLAERGVPARLVWLSRQIRGLLVMLLGLLLILPPLIGVIATDHPPNGHPVNGTLVIECLLGFAVAAYACGQLCSMGIRSGILAATFGTILTAVVCTWAANMHWLGLSWLWTVGPLLLAFMAVTWLHAPNWLAERKNWLARLRLALVVAVPALAILAAIPPVRVYEIPLVGPGFDVNEFTPPGTPEERETLALCARADKLLDEAQEPGRSAVTGDLPPPVAVAPARRKVEEQVVALALEIARRPPLQDSRSRPAELEDYLAAFLLASGEQLQSEGKLDAAFDRYVAAQRIALHTAEHWRTSEREIGLCEQLTKWATQRGQTSQRLLESLRILEKLWGTPLSYSNEIKREYLWLRRDLEERGLESLRGNTREWYDPYVYMSWLPWERARAMRLLNYLTGEELTRYTTAGEVLAAGGFLTCPPDEQVSPTLYGDITYKILRARVTPYANLVVEGRIENYGFLDAYLRVETHRRATRLILALEAWKLDHGGLPKSLEDLKGKYLDRLPVDPYTGEPFRYEPKGLACQVSWHRPDFGGVEILEPRRPFVACGCWVTKGYEELIDTEPSPPEPPRESTAAPVPNKEWKGVWVFPIR
jgi:hypothetical protein